MVKSARHTDVHNNSSSTDEEKLLQSPTAASGVCQHIKKSVDATKLRKEIRTVGLVSDCTQCRKVNATQDPSNVGFEYDNTLWLCLKCGTQLCGRSKHQHALQHFKTAHSDSHALTMNTRSFEIWCYECDNEVSANCRKNLLECVEFVKKIAQKPQPPPPTPTIITSSIMAEALATVTYAKLPAPWKVTSATPLPPPPPPPAPSFPGTAKRIIRPTCSTAPILSSIFRNNIQSTTNKAMSDEALPRVRGLTNLGNTCFFNAVMQCLAQTPYLLEVLKESSQPGEEFILPGGNFKLTEDKEVNLPMIKGTLSSWESLTALLAQALEELQSGGGVFTPSKLFDKLCAKCPQFRGGDQHDSHELLRHLLESVRSEDLKRYQRVILQNLNYKDQDSVSDEMKIKCKIYGNQAADRILRPDQVFRGFLVSTLTCQDCYNVSSRHEYFLDLSLPVSVEKPQPPQRRKMSPDSESATSKTFLENTSPTGSTKSQQKKEKKREIKAKRAAKHLNNKLQQKLKLEKVTDGGTDMSEAIADGSVRDETSAVSSICSSSEQSDADVEDNLIEDNTTKKITRPLSVAAVPNLTDPNGNNQPTSPTDPEKRGDSPEIMNKDSLDEDENDSGIATSPANASENVFTEATQLAGNSVLAVGISEGGATLVRQLSGVEGPEQEHNNINALGIPTATIKFNDSHDDFELLRQLDKMKINEQKEEERKHTREKRTRTHSYSDWSTTIAPRYQCEDGECSLQSCLNNFTAVELMTGNNKVGCENCTKRFNGDDPKAKTINTNATKQFLVSSPPAVLILHLKRFQLGPRCIFRKLTRAVSFPMVLDIAPFCGSKVKNLPNIDRKQKKLLYALYGVVEHSGGMYGGHYTAFVKVRSQLSPDDVRWKFMPQGSKAELDQDDEQLKKLDELLAKEKARDLRMKSSGDSDDYTNSCSTSSSSTNSVHEEGSPLKTINTACSEDEAINVQVPVGKWYYVSDSRVQEVKEEEVLRAQAYLLFYERIY